LRKIWWFQKLVVTLQYEIAEGGGLPAIWPFPCYFKLFSYLCNSISN